MGLDIVFYALLVSFAAIGLSIAVKEKNNVLAHPRTWQGEQLIPPPSIPQDGPGQEQKRPSEDRHG